MKYFIGCLIKGDVKKYQEKLIDKISKNFGVRNLNEHIPAHFTLKAPFEAKHIDSIKKLLEKFSLKEKRSRIKIDGIGNFHRRVIYLKGDFSPEALQTFRGLNNELKKISWIEFDKYDLIEDNFHSTLARAKNDWQFENIMKFLSSEKPYFEFEFDSIAIFQNKSGRWGICKEFELGR